MSAPLSSVDAPSVTRCQGDDNHPSGRSIPCPTLAVVGWGHHGDYTTVWLCVRHFKIALDEADQLFELRLAP